MNGVCGGYERSPLRRLTGDALRVGGVELTRRGLALCAFAPGARVLDVGCGPGRTLELLREAGLCALGLDVSLLFLQEIRKRFGDAFCVRGDMDAPPLGLERLDGVVCECALSLAQDKAAVLDVLASALVPGGRLLLSDLVLAEPERTGRGRPSGAELPCAAGAVTLETLLALLERVGFTVLHQEDHTRALRELAARIVWEFGSLDAFAELCPGARSGPGAGCGASTKRLGYTLLIAEKEGRHVG